MGQSEPAGEEQDDAASIWHLSWQAAVGREFFASPSLYARVRSRLIDAHLRPGRVLLHYLLLPMEIHLLSVTSPPDSAGGIARAIGNVVARWVRQTHPVRSPVFAAPFHAHRIPSADALRDDVRMLAWRPVLLGLCRTPSHHAHSGLRAELGLTPAQGFDSRPLLDFFGEGVQRQRAAMREWLAKRPSERASREWELTRGLPPAQGRLDPAAMVMHDVHGAAAAALVAAGGSAGIAGALRLLEAWVTTKLGAGGALDLHGQSTAASARGRALVACLAVKHRLCSAATVARHFGRAKATLSEQMTACRVRAVDLQILATPVVRIVEEGVALSVRRA